MALALCFMVATVLTVLVGDWRSIFVFQAAVALAVLIATVFGLKESRTHALRAEARGKFPEKVTAFREGMAVHGRYGQPCPR